MKRSTLSSLLAAIPLMQCLFVSGCQQQPAADTAKSVAKNLLPAPHTVVRCELEAYTYQLDSTNRYILDDLIRVLSMATPVEAWTQFKEVGFVKLHTDDGKTVHIRLYQPHYYGFEAEGKSVYFLHDSGQFFREVIDWSAKSDTAADVQELDGTWLGMDAEYDGVKATEEQVKAIRFTFKGDTLEMHAGDTVQKTRYKTDAKQKPCAIDVIAVEGEEAATVVQGIYALDGDALKLSFNNPLTNKKRPRSFATKAESGQILYVLRRSSK